MKIVLASGSPRRRELLSLITENFTVCPADADETLREGAPLADEVVRLSRLKAEAAQREHPDAVCIGSDTMVTIDHLPLGKPKDERDAANMLRRLRGRTHEVLTGLAVLSPASRSTRRAPTAFRTTARCSSRASAATITASWVCRSRRSASCCAV